MKLLVIESPGKQKTIQKYLGAEWRVVASLGHIRGLAQNLEFLTRDFEPTYEYLKEKAKAMKELKEKAKDAEEIYLAADKDFEGEQIAYSVCLFLKLNPKTTKRVTFTEITQKALTHAIENPGIIDMDRVQTQQARSMLDLLIGFTISPLLWRYVSPSLSAGRCQTPALRLVVERENQINTFKASSSWQLHIEWVSKQAKKTFPAKMEDELEDEESAKNYMENVHQTKEGTILSKQIRPWSERAPLPLITSTLQQQASALFHSNPKQTMKIAQRLYEAGHITYMRTDQAVLSEDATKEATKWVQDHYGEEFVGEREECKEEKKTKKKTKKEGEPKAQEAHEAIRPTHIEQTELPDGDWTVYDQKVYRLIWQRTIQSVMAPAQGEICQVRTQLEEDEFTWISQWKRTTFEGWKQAGKVVEIDQESEEEDAMDSSWSQVQELQVGEKIQWNTMKAEPKETKAQGRYTEATLVRELEKYGIGRPSTFASLLATIQEKGYVEIKNIPAKEVQVKEYTMKLNQWPPQEKSYKKKVGAETSKLVPTELGRSVLDFALQHFEDLFNYTFTSQMERRLDQVAEGKEPWKQVVKDMWESYKDRYEDLLAKQSLKKKEGESNAKVREFSGGLKAVQSKKGPLLLIEGETKEETVFLGWPTGVSFDAMTEEKARKFQEEAIKKKEGNQLGEWKGHIILKKSGKFGEYVQCGELSIPFQEESLEKTIERLEAKENSGKQVIKEWKEYVIRNGPYGPYIMKTSVKKAQFVSFPKGIDISKVTEKEVEGLYKMGLEAKKQWKSKKA